MKKINTNKMVALLASLCLITSAFVGSTLAKYVTTTTAADDARVAEWGVVVSAWNTDAADKTTFATSYGTTVDAGADFVVAPGTETPTDGELKFSITGAPEVAVKLDVKFNITNEAVLPAGTYLDDTTGNLTTDEYTIDENYYPVKFTLVQDSDPNTKLVDGGNLTAVKNAIEGLANANIAPNTDLSTTYGSYTLTWAWDYGNADTDAGYDQEDTTLGNKAAGKTITTSGTDTAVTDIDFDIAITATQID